MKFKKFIALFIAMLTIFTISFSTIASASLSSNGFDYQRIGSTSTATLLGLTQGGQQESNTIVTVPSSLGGMLITVVGSSAFANNSFQQQIILPNTVTDINSNAFYNASALTTMNIPKNVVEISSSAFAYCTNLETVTFSTTQLTELPRNMFIGSTRLNNVVLPSSVNTINEYAFANCTALTRIYIPESTSSISTSAFYNVPNLTIYGVSGSTAEYYALSNNFKFVALEQNKNTTSLNNWIIAAEYKLSQNLSDYTVSTVTALQNQYNRSVQVKDDFFSTQAVIDKSAADLKNAYNSLKLTAMLELEESVKNANTYLEEADIYTSDTVQTLKLEVEKANQLIDSNSTDVTDVSNAVSRVNTAVAVLVYQSKVDLQQLLTKANDILTNKSDLYTTGSITRLKTSVNNATAVLNNTNAANNDFLTQKTALEAALNKLVLQSYNTLSSNISKYEAFINSSSMKYTEETVNELKNQIDNAKQLLNNTNSTNEQLVHANDALVNAYSSLEKVLTGDVSLDNRVSIVDAVLALRNVVGTAVLDERQKFAADVNGDGNVTVTDAVLIQRIILSLPITINE